MSEHDPLINVQAEAVVLGGMMLNNRLIVEFSDRLRADDFAEPVHQRIYSAMLRFSAKGTAATAASLRPVFALDRDSDGGNYLNALVDSPAAVIGVPDLVAQVGELAVRRKAREAMRGGVERIQDLEQPVGDVVGSVEEQIWAAERNDDEGVTLDLGEMVGIVRERQKRIEKGEQTVGATNALIGDLDTALGPLERATYTILAGRPGMGKTTVASSAAIGYALRGFPGLILGTEMSEEQHSMRTVSDLSLAMGQGIPHDDIRRGNLDAGQMHWLDRVEERAKLLPLRYRKVGACNWRKIYSLVAREKARLAAIGKTLWFVVVDYMGMLEADDASGKPIDDDRKRMNAVSKGMMRIRDELGVAVIALAQLSRDVDRRPDKRPHNADLKESGNLEQDADAILFAYREEYYLEQAEPKQGEKGAKGNDLHEEWEVEMQICRDKLDLIVGKNRHDQRRTRTVKFLGRHYAVRGAKFRDWEDMEELSLQP